MARDGPNLTTEIKSPLQALCVSTYVAIEQMSPTRGAPAFVTILVSGGGAMTSIRCTNAASLMLAAALTFTACSGGSSGSPGSAANVVPQLPDGSAAAPVTGLNRTPAFHATALPSGFTPYAIMPDGSIAGSQGNDAAVYRRGSVTSLGHYLDAQTVATSVNRHGVAVGYALRTSTTPAQWFALLFANGHITDLGQPPSPPTIEAPLAYVRALTINDNGQILGAAQDIFSTGFPILTRFFTDKAPVLISFATFPFDRGIPFRINNSGQYAFTDIPAFASDVFRAYRGSGDTLTQVFPQFIWSSAGWINDKGTIAGAVNKTDDPTFLPQTAYVAGASGVQYLPNLTGANAMSPSGIDDRGEVSGDASGPSITGRIFFYASGTTYDVTPSLPPNVNGYRTVPGMSNDGSFVVCGGQCLLVSPGK